MFIYLITCLANGKYYVGQTIQKIKDRWNSHLSCSRNGDPLLLYNAIRKYGEDSFVCQELCKCPDQESLDKSEVFYIWFLASNKRSFGYNVSEGGNGGHKNSHTLETKQIISYKLKGRKFSKKEKETLRKSHLGVPLSDSHRNSISLGLLRKKELDKHLSDLYPGSDKFYGISLASYKIAKLKNFKYKQ